MVAAWINAEMGVGQPDVQRELCRFAHGADEQADADDRNQRPGGAGNQLYRHLRQQWRRLEYGRVVECLRVRQHKADAKQEAEIADAVHQEGLEVGVDSRRPREPEADEQIGHQTHRFPAEEQLQEVVGHHQHQHGESEQRNVAEEALVAGIVLHVADGVDVHHPGDEAHHQHHGHREPVDEKAHLELDVTHGHPGIDRAIEIVTGQHVHEDVA